MTSGADISKGVGIYIHVPFCLRKCPYCDFYSCENSLHKRDAYVQAVCRNLEAWGRKLCCTAETVYFGGGTPSLLEPSHIEKIMTVIQNCFILSPNAEITMEVNPATVNSKSLSGYRKAGVNRLSVGVQDLQDSSLTSLGRLHTAQQAVETVYTAVSAGFENISCDLMIGTKGQTSQSLADTLSKLTSLPVQHISAYMLKIEEGTAYAELNMKTQIPDDDQTADLYLQMVSFLESKGFMQYEVSNFAKKGYESRHNCRYWRCEPYLGIGPAAHSCIDSRFYVLKSLDDFISAEVQTEICEDENPCANEERLMLALRLAEGVSENSFTESQLKTVRKYERFGFMSENNGRVRFTKEGFLVMNSILAEII